jgi:hypothetical protein
MWVMVKHLASVFVLATMLSSATLGGTVSGRITGIAVDPSDPIGLIQIVSTTVSLLGF